MIKVDRNMLTNSRN